MEREAQVPNTKKTLRIVYVKKRKPAKPIKCEPNETTLEPVKVPRIPLEGPPTQKRGMKLSINGLAIRRLPMPRMLLDDDYKWHKYGQKLLKGHIYPVSYFSCSHPSCPARRQTVYDPKDDTITSTYIGDHTHSKTFARRVIADGADYLNKVMRCQRYFSNNSIVDGYGCHVLNDLEKQIDRGAHPDGLEGDTTITSVTTNITFFLVNKMINPFEDTLSWCRYGEKTINKSGWRMYFRCAREGCICVKIVECFDVSEFQPNKKIVFPDVSMDGDRYVIQRYCTNSGSVNTHPISKVAPAYIVKFRNMHNHVL